ncbi:hypothetical protein [Spirochaeta africana]|uniref:hypothetical protein n=1 Tax=Spirochaeta africana TaxID=46355 RepID=UPI00145FBFCE|nr:hypothetical protein [Spirochaeta africana]
MPGSSSSSAPQGWARPVWVLGMAVGQLVWLLPVLSWRANRVALPEPRWLHDLGAAGILLVLAAALLTLAAAVAGARTVPAAGAAGAVGARTVPAAGATGAAAADAALSETTAGARAWAKGAGSPVSGAALLVRQRAAASPVSGAAPWYASAPQPARCPGPPPWYASAPQPARSPVHCRDPWCCSRALSACSCGSPLRCWCSRGSSAMLSPAMAQADSILVLAGGCIWPGLQSSCIPSGSGCRGRFGC